MNELTKKHREQPGAGNLPTIERLQTYSWQAGDVIVATVTCELGMAQREEIQVELEGVFGCQVIVLDNGAKIEVFRPIDEPEPEEAA